MCKYGYARVSSREQNTARQLIALKKAGIEEKRIFVDRMSGQSFERPQWKRLVRKLAKGDVLFIKSIDRMGRNYVEIKEQWRKITQEKEVDIVVLDMPLLDTRIAKNLIGTFVSDNVLQVLSFASQSERENIKKRQREGIDAAKKRGVRFGRPKGKIPCEFKRIAALYEEGRMSCREACAALGISRPTFFRWKKTME